MGNERATHDAALDTLREDMKLLGARDGERSLAGPGSGVLRIRRRQRRNAPSYRRLSPPLLRSAASAIMFAPRLLSASGGVGSTTAPASRDGSITVAVPGLVTSPR